jgi:hypothetical protein
MIAKRVVDAEKPTDIFVSNMHLSILTRGYDDVEFFGYHEQFPLKLDTLGMFNVPIVPEE